jgi:hypothetical protein
MAVLGGEEVFLLHILDPALDRGEWWASRPSRALPPGKGPPVPIGKEAEWAPEPVWMQKLEEKFFASAGDWPPFVQPYSQTLYWLSYRGSFRRIAVPANESETAVRQWVC